MKKLIIILLAGLFVSNPGMGQDIPDPMQPPRMVNDFSGLLEAGNREELEKKLQDFYQVGSVHSDSMMLLLLFCSTYH